MKSKNKKNKLRTSMKIYGMTCSACKTKIETELENNKDIKSAKVSLKNKSVEVEHTNKTNKQDIEKIIKNAGYTTKKENATRKGLMYGLIPHAGCIAFIIASIVGATFFTNLLRPVLMSTNLFYLLIAVSVVFATLSATIYLKKNGLLSYKGVKKQKKYLATLYGTTLVINLVLFLLIFPLTANLASASASTATEDSKTLELEVTIPCSGHAPLIINELNTERGIQEVRYSFPYTFRVKYDGEETNPEEILSAEIFKEFPAQKK